jgi:hypothetical protein
MLTFLTFFSSCKKTYKINNKYLTALAPKDYVDITHFERNEVLFLDQVLKNGLESIFAIDNITDLTIQTNAESIKTFTPSEILLNRLKSIEEETQEPNCGWSHFVMTNAPKAILFKGYKAAEATFSVEENVNQTGKIIKKKIKRMVVFTENDLWNIVLAPSELANYENEMAQFNLILESMQIK